MDFSLEYMISLAMALTGAWIMQRGAPASPTIIKFGLVPFLLAYITLQLVNNLFPWLNSWGRSIQNYLDNRMLGQVNSADYIQVFPTLMIVLVFAIAMVFLLR